jgi:hypothetical protein
LFNIFEFPEILDHLRNISFIGLKSHGSELYPISLICPYCNDGFRKDQGSISHGHLHVAKHIPYFKCFLCDTSGNISKLLRHTGFTNRTILSEIGKLSSNTNFITNNNREHLPTHINNIQNFMENHPNEFKIYYDYIINKFGINVDPYFFKLYPLIFKNCLFIGYVNYDNQMSNSVKIYGNEYDKRFYKPHTNVFYYFQNPIELYDCENIVITEGGSDLINMYLYSSFGRDSYYICNSGKNYVAVLNYLIENYILIRKVSLHIIFDSDLKFLKKTMSGISNVCKINSNISINFYHPEKKDVSDFMKFRKI